MRNQNRDLKDLAKAKGVFIYEIAEKCGISVETFQKRLRKPLTEAQRTEIITFIDEIAAENAAST